MKFLHQLQQGILVLYLFFLGGLETASQAAELNKNVDSHWIQINVWQGGQWKSIRDARQYLDATTLMEDLNALMNREDCFRELGRLILAQGWKENQKWANQHNNKENTGPNYMDKAESQNDLQKAMIDLLDHMFDHGHLGWYPQAEAINQQDAYAIVDGNPDKSPRGIFNVNAEIRTRIAGNIQPSITGGNFILKGFPRTRGYNIDSPVNRNDQRSSLKRAAINLIKMLFSSNSFNPINIVMAQPPYQNTRFTITATYTGGNIDGLDYQAPAPAVSVQAAPAAPIQAVPAQASTRANRLGFQNNRAQTPTNEICVVVEVTDGRIRIVSLFPFG